MGCLPEKRKDLRYSLSYGATAIKDIRMWMSPTCDHRELEMKPPLLFSKISTNHTKHYKSRRTINNSLKRANVSGEVKASPLFYMALTERRRGARSG